MISSIKRKEKFLLQRTFAERNTSITLTVTTFIGQGVYQISQYYNINQFLLQIIRYSIED